MMSAGQSTGIREIHVLSNQQSLRQLRCVPDRAVWMAAQQLLRHGIHVVSGTRQYGRQFWRYVFVKLEFHERRERSRTTGGAFAKAAANAMAARISSAVSVGK